MATTRKFAADDANLNVGSIVTTRTKKYSDIDLLFGVNSNTGDIFIKKDAAAVKQAVKSLILTNFYERPFKPTLGSGVSGLLFELSDFSTLGAIETYVELCIKNFEPRAKIINITAEGDPDQNFVTVEIEFQVVTLTETITLEIVLERLR